MRPALSNRLEDRNAGNPCSPIGDPIAPICDPSRTDTRRIAFEVCSHRRRQTVVSNLAQHARTCRVKPRAKSCLESWPSPSKPRRHLAANVRATVLKILRNQTVPRDLRVAKKSDLTSCFYCINWRRGRDSNPRSFSIFQRVN